MISIEELVAPQSADEVFETFLTELETLGVPAKSWRKGGVARTILRVVAKTYSGFTELMADAISAGFLETATGSWLTVLAKQVFNVERQEATFATGELLFTNTGGGIYSFNEDEVRALWEDEGKAYANAESFTLNPAESKLIAVRAVEVGSASSAPPNTITELETFILGVTVTNPEAVVGNDAETDEELRTACRNKLAALSVRGPRDAYAFAVREAKRPDGSSVDINRQQVSPSSSTGTVTVYVASPSGAPSPTDIQYVEESIEAIARPDSVTVTVLAATEVPLTRTVTVWARRTSGVSAESIKTAVEKALIDEIKVYPIGGIPKPPSSQGYLYEDFLAGVVKGAHLSIYDVDGLGDDVALAPGDVVTLAATVTVRIVEVS
jgi:hypothetical protein